MTGHCQYLCTHRYQNAETTNYEVRRQKVFLTHFSRVQSKLIVIATHDEPELDCTLSMLHYTQDHDRGKSLIRVSVVLKTGINQN
jgi:hypothetical protein